MARGNRQGVLFTLGLQRGNRGGANQNANQQPPPNVNQQPPPNVNQQPPPNANQPPVQNPNWARADANMADRGRMVGNDTRTSANFKSTLGTVMPLVQRARKVFLTVDGRARAEEKTAPDSDLTGELQQLAARLAIENGKLDVHARTVRERSEASSFGEATTALEEAGEVAQGMLLMEQEFTDLLNEYAQPLPPVLAGEVVPGIREFQHEYANNEPAIREVLDDRPETALLRHLQENVDQSHAKVIGARNKQDYQAASDALPAALEDVQIYLDMKGQTTRFLADWQTHEREFSQLKKLRSKDKEFDEKRTAALSLRDTAYDEATVKGDFVKAWTHFKEAIDAATKLLPNNEDAIEVDGLLGEFEPLYRLAMQEKVVCPVMEADKKQLDAYREEIDDLCQDGDYSRASDVVAMAISRAHGVLRTSGLWADFQAQLAASAQVIDAATKLQVGPDFSQAKADALAAVTEAKRLVGEDGLFTDGKQKLTDGVALCESLLEQGGSPEMLAYYRALDAHQATLDAAESLRSDNPLVQNAQQTFLTELGVMRQQESNGRFDQAVGQIETALIGATDTLALQEQYASYQRDVAAFGRLFTVAMSRKAASVAGVPELQVELARLQQNSQAALANDLKAARRTLQDAVKVANKIAELHEHLGKQESRHADLGERLGKVAQTYLPPGGADNLANAGLGDNGDFTALLNAMRAAETDRSTQNLNAITQAANAYLAPFRTLSDEERDALDAQVKRRIQIAETALKQAKHLGLANTFAGLGDPPWDAATEDRAADLHAKTMFETGDLPLEASTGGVMGSKWIKSMDYEKGEGRRDYLFKRGDAKSMGGFPDGGDAPREVLADAVGRILKSATGVDFGVPETRIIGVDAQMLRKNSPPGEILGSAQAAAPCIGDVGDLFANKPEMLAKISAKAIQKATIFDMVALNMDRHQGNFLVSPPSGEAGECDLIPIDNGLAFPTLDGFLARSGKCSSASVVPRLPNAFEPFDEEALAIIDTLDADEIVDGMRQRLTELDQQHPDMRVLEKVPPESMTLTKRSIAFMKRAARELSPAFMTDVLMSHGSKLFQCPDNEFEALADRLIAKAKADAGDYAPFLKMSDQEREDFFMVLFELGWNLTLNAPDFGTSLIEWNAWARRNAKLALAAHRKNEPCPEIAKETTQKLDEIEAVAPDEAREIRERLPRSTFRGGAEDVARQYKIIKPERLRAQQRLLDDFQRAFPKASLPTDARGRENLAKKYERFLRWGGKSLTTINGRKAARYSFDDQYNFLSAQGQEQDQAAKDLLVQSNEFRAMIGLLESIFNNAGEFDFLRDEDVLEVRNQIGRWNEFQRLGGLEAYASYGFDSETIDATFDYAIANMKVAAMLAKVNPDTL